MAGDLGLWSSRHRSWFHDVAGQSLRYEVRNGCTSHRTWCDGGHLWYLTGVGRRV